MDQPKNIEPAGKPSARTEKMERLEKSSIFASRPLTASSRKVEEQKAAKSHAGRKWLGFAALAIVLGVVLVFGINSMGMGLQNASGLSGFAGGAAEAASSIPSEVSVVEATFTPTVTFTPTITFTPTLSIGASLIRPSDGMVMMYVPSGEFTMGISVDEALVECAKIRDECERNWFIDEEPSHLVYLDAYWMDQIEVTNAMYALCVNAGACVPPKLAGSETTENYFNNPAYADYPVVFIPWKQANNYCQWAGARLPTEAEWEKAARGTDARLYPWGSTSPDCSLSNINPFNGNFCNGDLVPSLGYPNGQSPYQIFNMAGNVAEWVADWYDQDYYKVSPYSNPQGPAEGLAKILRGGSWYYDELFARSTYRYKQDARYYYSFTGFRCAVSE